MIASIVGIATGIKALIDDDGGPPPGETPADIRAAHVRDCVREHELTQASQRREPLPGESEITEPDPLPEFAVFEQRTYATCDWPPPPGGFPDGYLAITVTTVDGPGEFEATGTNYADRVESRCQVLELDFIFGSMGAFEHLPPSAVGPARRCTATARRGRRAPSARGRTPPSSSIRRATSSSCFTTQRTPSRTFAASPEAAAPAAPPP